jgi:hypothetical protein
MAQASQRVRMRVTIDQQRVLLELLLGQEYDLPVELAQRLIDSGAAEPAAITPRLEAAVLAGPRRRG